MSLTHGQIGCDESTTDELTDLGIVIDVVIVVVGRRWCCHGSNVGFLRHEGRRQISCNKNFNFINKSSLYSSFYETHLPPAVVAPADVAAGKDG